MRQEETSGVATPEGDASLCLQGVNHLALNTDNMRTTLEFYTRVLGMRLVHAGRALEPVDLSGQPLDRSASGQPPHADVRHYMLDMGGGSLLAFFEYPPGTPRGDCNRVATMQHVSFTVSQQHFALAQKRLQVEGIDVFGPVDRGIIHSIYFYDPNGIRLELSTSVRNATWQGVEEILQTSDCMRQELRSLYETDDALDAFMNQYTMTQ